MVWGYDTSTDDIVDVRFKMPANWPFFFKIQCFCPYLLNYYRYGVWFSSKYAVLEYDESNSDITYDVRFKMADWQPVQSKCYM